MMDTAIAVALINGAFAIVNLVYATVIKRKTDHVIQLTNSNWTKAQEKIGRLEKELRVVKEELNELKRQK